MASWCRESTRLEGWRRRARPRGRSSGSELGKDVGNVAADIDGAGAIRAEALPCEVMRRT